MLQIAEGFQDAGSSFGRYTTLSQVTIEADVDGRIAGRLSGTQQWTGTVLTTPVSSLFYGARINPRGDGCRISFRGDVAQKHVFLQYNGTLGRWEARKGVDSSLLAAGPSLGAPTEIPHYIEIQLIISDTVGVFNVWQDDVQIIAVSGADTRNAGADANIYTLQYETNNNNGFRFTDIVIYDTTGTAWNVRQGPVVIETLRPNGDGATNAWLNQLGTSVNNWSYVDENPPNGDTDWNESATAAALQLYGYADLSIATGTILAVTQATIGKDSLGAAGQIRNAIRRAAVNNFDAARALGPVYDMTQRIMTQDPTDASAWTIAKVNACEFGQDRV